MTFVNENGQRRSSRTAGRDPPQPSLPYVESVRRSTTTSPTTRSQQPSTPPNPSHQTPPTRTSTLSAVRNESRMTFRDLNPSPVDSDISYQLSNHQNDALEAPEHSLPSHSNSPPYRRQSIISNEDRLARIRRLEGQPPHQPPSTISTRQSNT